MKKTVNYMSSKISRRISILLDGELQHQFRRHGWQNISDYYF